MIKINKGYNLKIISLMAASIFLLNSAVYGIELPTKFYLRVPSMPTTKEGEKRLEEGLARESGQREADKSTKELYTESKLKKLGIRTRKFLNTLFTTPRAKTAEVYPTDLTKNIDQTLTLKDTKTVIEIPKVSEEAMKIVEEAQIRAFQEKYNLKRSLTKEETFTYLASVDKIASVHTGEEFTVAQVQNWLNSGVASVWEKTDGTKVIARFSYTLPIEEIKRLSDANKEGDIDTIFAWKTTHDNPWDKANIEKGEFYRDEKNGILIKRDYESTSTYERIGAYKDGYEFGYVLVNMYLYRSSQLPATLFYIHVYEDYRSPKQSWPGPSLFRLLFISAQILASENGANMLRMTRIYKDAVISWQRLLPAHDIRENSHPEVGVITREEAAFGWQPYPAPIEVVIDESISVARTCL